MTRALCTYCSAEKREDHGLLPAVERYRSKRIRMLAMRAAWRRTPFLILSGKYGLLDPDEPIPWYDHLLLPIEVETMASRVGEQLSGLPLEGIIYHTAPLQPGSPVRPYFEVISAACARTGLDLDIRILPANLD